MQKICENCASEFSAPAKRRFCSYSCSAIARCASTFDKRGIEALHEILHYDPDTGVWTWKVRRAQQIGPGKVAGSLSQDGHRYIGISGKLYLSSRLAWLYITGEWPPDLIDHRDPDKPGDDRWGNLRLATKSQNNCNKRQRRDNASGYKGVSFDKTRNKWHACISVNGKTKHLGRHATAEDAHAAYCSAAQDLFGEFFHPGQHHS